MLSCERVTLFLADADAKELHVGVSEDLAQRIVPYGVGLAGHCAASLEVTRVDDAYADARFDKAIDHETGYRTRAVLCCPMVDGRGRLVAVCEALNPLHGGPFSPRDLELLQCVRTPMAVALLNARLHRSLAAAPAAAASPSTWRRPTRRRRRRGEAGGGNDNQGAPRDVSLMKLMEKVIELAIERFGADRCSMYVCDYDKGEIWSLVAKGVHTRFSVPVGHGISGACAKTGEVINVRDASRDPRTSHQHATSTGYKMHSTLCAPVLDQRPSSRAAERPALGVIQLLNKVDAPGHFTSGDETALRAFCSIVGLAMRNAMAFDEMREKEAERHEIFSSISSFICKFDMGGSLKWCNAPKQLEGLLGCREEAMRDQRFDGWLAPFATPPGAHAVVLGDALQKCLAHGAKARARGARAEVTPPAPEATPTGGGDGGGDGAAAPRSASSTFRSRRSSAPTSAATTAAWCRWARCSCWRTSRTSTAGRRPRRSSRTRTSG